jgi:hypothetical protein
MQQNWLKQTTCRYSERSLLCCGLPVSSIVGHLRNLLPIAFSSLAIVVPVVGLVGGAGIDVESQGHVIKSFVPEASQFQRTETGGQPVGKAISVKILKAEQKAW